MSLGARIRELRETLGVSQGRWGEELGVRQATISAWENGRAEPHPRNLRRVAETTGDPGAVLAWLRNGGPTPRAVAPGAVSGRGRAGPASGGPGGEPGESLLAVERWIRRQELSLRLLAELREDLGSHPAVSALEAAMAASTASKLMLEGAAASLRTGGPTGERELRDGSADPPEPAAPAARTAPFGASGAADVRPLRML